MTRRQADTGSGYADLFADIAATWRPDPIEVTETITAGPARDLAALLGTDPPDDVLPPLWHSVYLLDRPTRAELGDDGHPRDGYLLPPLPERRRMFGGGVAEFVAPIRIGETVTRRSTVADVRVRDGRSGALLLVAVRHTYLVDGVERVVEQHDLVYRDPTAARASSAPEPEDAEGPTNVLWRFTLPTDPVTLFRFSALTANAHRIHYDHPYATEVEGYPGLLVHGPLLALALLELPRRHAPQASVRTFAYRLHRPCQAGAPVEVTGRPDGADVNLSAGPSSNISGTASLTGPPPR
ncbi:MaoC family dehydratase N-terminal domain-containing protein [Yinghuangia aomiensis]|uniref:MaoC family dehydratase N-terminal domain-containing protein n=1 Tax=Yinghuangia aomiensis TaxID=676205 RepID=A0ABP9HQD5_9ACTN